MNAFREEIGLHFNDLFFVFYAQHDFFRMECLEKVQNRQADFLAADPEDMYVAFNIKNEDFSIFSELRTVS